MASPAAVPPDSTVVGALDIARLCFVIRLSSHYSGKSTAAAMLAAETRGEYIDIAKKRDRLHAVGGNAECLWRLSLERQRYGSIYPGAAI